MQFFVVTLRDSRGCINSVTFCGTSSNDVLYAVFEMYPDCQVVRICRDTDWETDRHGAVAAGR